MLLLLVVFFPLVICMSRWLDDFPTHSIVKKRSTAGRQSEQTKSEKQRAQGNEKVKELREQKKKGES